MLYCFYNYKTGFIEHSDIDKIYAKRNKIFCLFDPEEETFKNEYDEKINIKGETVFPVSGILPNNEFIDKIKENGGIIPSDLDKQYIVINWLDYYNPKRKILKIKGYQLLDDNFLKNIENLFGENFFFKTLKKNYSECININYLKNKNSIFYNAIKLHKDEEFIISEKINILKDDIGKKEYRIYVYNGNIINISRVTISMLHKIDREIYDKALEIVKELSMTDFVKSYVLDLCVYEKDNQKEIDVIEFNSFISSGRYLYNTIMKLEADNILHDNLYKIAPEKQDLIPLCSHPIYENHNELQHSILFEQEDSFAYDLKQLHDEGILKLNNDLNLNKNINPKILEMLINKKTKKSEKKENISNPILDILKEANKEIYEKKQKEFSKITKCPLEFRFLAGTDKYSLKENDENLGILDNGFLYHIVNDYQDKATEFMITDNFIVNELIPILKNNNININYDKLKVKFINYGDTELVYVISDGINRYTMLVGQPITKYNEIKEEYDNLQKLGSKHIEVIKPISYLKGKKREAYITPYLKQARCIATTSNGWGYYIPEPIYRFELFNDNDKSLVTQAMVATLVKLYDEKNEQGICNCKLGGGDFILNKKWDNIDHNIYNTLNNLKLISARKMYLTTLKDYINILSHELTKVTYYKDIKDKNTIINCKNRYVITTKDIEEGIELGLKLRKHNL